MNGRRKHISLDEEESSLTRIRSKNRGMLRIPLIFLWCLILGVALAAQAKKDPSEEKKRTAVPEKIAPARADPGTENKNSREQGVQWPKWLQPTLAIRGRLEQPWGRNYASHNEDLYYLGRIAVGASILPSKYLTFFVMGQDARVWFYNNLKGRPRGMKDTFDLRQLYVDIHRKQESSALALRIGRQYLDFGGRRLVAVSTWSNSTPVYDAARLTYTHSTFKMDLFASTRVSDTFTYKYNRNRAGENLYGIYTNFPKLIPQASLQPYLFWRTQPSVTGETGTRGDSDLWTIGVRIVGKWPNRVDYILEEVLQRGTYAVDDVSAYGMIYQIGYQVSPAKWKPRIGVDFNYASGDTSRIDGKRGTFDQLYPSNHNVFGMTDQVGWRNLLHWKWSFDCTPHPKIKLLFSMNNLYLATLQDGLYNSSGSQVVRNPNATSRHIGWEPDVQLDYNFNKRLSVGFGVSRLFPGKFLQQSTSGHAYTYPYVMWEYKF